MPIPIGKYARVEITVPTKETAIRLAKTLVQNRLATRAKLEPDPVFTFDNFGSKIQNAHTVSVLTETRYASAIQEMLNHFAETRGAELLVIPIEMLDAATAMKITENLGSLPTV